MKWIPLSVLLSGSLSLAGCISAAEELELSQQEPQPNGSVARSALTAGSACGVAVPQGGLVDASGRVLNADGTPAEPSCLPVSRVLALSGGLCGGRPCPDPVVDPVPPPHDNYLAEVSATMPGTTVSYNRVEATIRVPPPPVVRAGHAPLIAIFPALQSEELATGFGDTILQPILMWGDWGLDGLASAWRIMAVVCTHNPNPDGVCTVYSSASSVVSPGDEISMYVGLTEFLFDRERWVVLISSNANPNASQWFFYETSRSHERFLTAMPLALEAYQLQDCADLPTGVVSGLAQAWRWGSRGPTSFARDVSYVRGSHIPGWSWPARFSPPECSVYPQVAAPTFPNSPARTPPTVAIHMNVP